MHTDIIVDHRWRFHSTTGKTTGTRQGIVDTGSRIAAAVIGIGTPMTVDTDLEAMAAMVTGVAMDITGNGNPMTGDITMPEGAIIAVTAHGDTKRTH